MLSFHFLKKTSHCVYALKCMHVWACECMSVHVPTCVCVRSACLCTHTFFFFFPLLSSSSIPVLVSPAGRVPQDSQMKARPLQMKGPSPTETEIAD